MGKPFNTVIAALVAVLLALYAGGVGGCALFCPDPGPHVRTGAGEVKMDWRTCRNLRVLEHACRRGRHGRLAVLVAFQNRSDDPYVAKLRVKFADAHGMLEKQSYETSVYRFPPGNTPLEWTSSTPDAESYVVEVWSGRFLQW